jgi:hypothetical protein
VLEERFLTGKHAPRRHGLASRGQQRCAGGRVEATGELVGEMLQDCAVLMGGSMGSGNG